MNPALRTLLQSLDARLNPGVYVYAAVPQAGVEAAPVTEALATFHEAEGLTLILEERRALALNLPVHWRCAWITLGVNSQLEGVGLTAAVSAALAAADIACNVVAAVHHDHLFVPVERGEEAMQILHGLARQAHAL